MFREEIAEPLGADFHIGLPASEDGRVAELIPPPPADAVGAGGSQTELQANMSRNPGVDVSETRTRAWRGAEIPAGSRVRVVDRKGLELQVAPVEGGT